MTKKLSLRDVAVSLEKRLGATPVKYYWREEKPQGLGEVICKGFEASFHGLRPEQVKLAMEGIPLVYKKKFNDRTYRWLYRWEFKDPALKFRCTLYVHTDNTQLFVFTADW